MLTMYGRTGWFTYLAQQNALIMQTPIISLSIPYYVILIFDVPMIVRIIRR